MKKTQIAVIEDDGAIRSLLVHSLYQAEFEVEVHTRADHALLQLHETRPELILLDWRLPGMDGISFIKACRKDAQLRHIPIIMLTSNAEEEHKLQGLETGADDYLTKPFSPKELIARIRAVLRRGTLVAPDEKIIFEDLILDLSRHTLYIDGEAILLTPRNFDLLRFFLLHQNKLLKREAILASVWGAQNFVDDRSVDTEVKRLRQKIGLYAACIETVRGEGYRWKKQS